jgi:hypothetical protein
MQLYEPEFFVDVPNLPRVPTSWDGLEKILPSILRRFGIQNHLAIEFGVWHGYSTAALANNFQFVLGIEPFTGDLLAGTTAPMIETTRRTLEPWSNIQLIQTGFFDYGYTVDGWPLHSFVPSSQEPSFCYLCNRLKGGSPHTASDDGQVDLIHTDIIHTYQHTFACGVLALQHTRCAIFHDTESFPEVKEALLDLAEISGYSFYNYPYCQGLGILVRESVRESVQESQAPAQ